MIDAAVKRGWTVRGFEPMRSSHTSSGMPLVLISVPGEKRGRDDDSSEEPTDLWFRFQRGSTPSELGREICNDKYLTSLVAIRCRMPHPVTEFVRTPEMAKAFLKRRGGPIVLKPIDAAHGHGVTTNVRTDAEAETAFHVAMSENRSKKWGGVLAQIQHYGDDYRLIIVGSKVVAVTKRVPANVTGDGRHNISELIDIANTDPRRGERCCMSKISLYEASSFLGGDEKLLRVPAADEYVPLGSKGNLSLGGEGHDYTDKIHPNVARECVRVAQKIGVGLCGLDVLSRDITKPDNWTILELNSSPGIRMHHFPSVGSPRDAAGAILDHAYESVAGYQRRRLEL